MFVINNRSGRIIVVIALVTGLMSIGCHINPGEIKKRILSPASKYVPPAPHPESEKINAFPRRNMEEMKQDLSGKKLALALITNYDDSHATKGLEKMFQQDFSDLPNYVLYTQRPKGLKEIFNDLRDYSRLKPIDGLILAYHGNQTGMSINHRQSINYSNVKKIFKNYSSVFSKDAVILLYSCSSGKGDVNIEKKIADVLNRDCMAPRFTLIPETDIKPKNRAGEFTLDKNGRLSFDFNHFRAYKRIDFNDSLYVDSVASVSYAKAHGEKTGGKNGKKYFSIVHKE